MVWFVVCIFRSAYQIFQQEQRPILKEEAPGLSITETLKELAKRWNLCEDREKYKKAKKRKKKKKVVNRPIKLLKTMLSFKNIYSYQYWVQCSCQIGYSLVV